MESRKIRIRHRKPPILERRTDKICLPFLFSFVVLQFELRLKNIIIFFDDVSKYYNIFTMYGINRENIIIFYYALRPMHYY